MMMLLLGMGPQTSASRYSGRYTVLGTFNTELVPRLVPKNSQKEKAKLLIKLVSYSAILGQCYNIQKRASERM